MTYGGMEASLSPRYEAEPSAAGFHPVRAKCKHAIQHSAWTFLLVGVNRPEVQQSGKAEIRNAEVPVVDEMQTFTDPLQS